MSSWVGTLPITNQWLETPLNGSQAPITNATNAVLVFANPQLSDSGNYQVEGFNSVNSDGVLGGQGTSLTVLPLPPAITSTAYGTLIQSQGALAYWSLNETNDASTGVLPAYDGTGNGYIGVWGADAQNGYNNVVGPQPSSTPTPYPGLSPTNTGLQTTALDTASVVTVPALNLNTNAEAVTITMWINPSANVGVNKGLFYHRTSADAAGLGFGNKVNASGMAELGYNWNNNSVTYNWDSGLYPLPNIWSYVSLGDKDKPGAYISVLR